MGSRHSPVQPSPFKATRGKNVKKVLQKKAPTLGRQKKAEKSRTRSSKLGLLPELKKKGKRETRRRKRVEKKKGQERRVAPVFFVPSFFFGLKKKTGGKNLPQGSLDLRKLEVSSPF